MVYKRDVCRAIYWEQSNRKRVVKGVVCAGTVQNTEIEVQQEQRLKLTLKGNGFLRLGRQE